MRRLPRASGPRAPTCDSAKTHEVDLVTVLETSDSFAVNLGKATLEDAGIEYVVEGDDPGERGLTGMSQMGAMAERLKVASASADEARELLEPLLNPKPAGEEETDDEPQA